MLHGGRAPRVHGVAHPAHLPAAGALLRWLFAVAQLQRHACALPTDMQLAAAAVPAAAAGAAAAVPAVRPIASAAAREPRSSAAVHTDTSRALPRGRGRGGGLREVSAAVVERHRRIQCGGDTRPRPLGSTGTTRGAISRRARHSDSANPRRAHGSSAWPGFWLHGRLSASNGRNSWQRTISVSVPGAVDSSTTRLLQQHTERGFF